ncbi:MAG: hypothetical protein ACJAZ9_001070 [Neolewinella sp.]|jgi:hypothetical protein
MRNTPVLLLLFCLFVASCSPSVQTLADSGDYDATINKSLDKLVGKGKKNPKFVASLESAFNKANAADLARADKMKNSGTAFWTRIYGVYKGIDRRQEKVRPLDPLTDKDGYQADLRFIRVASLLNDAGGKAAAQLYEEGTRLLGQGRSGNKEAARGAFASFESIEQYQRNYRDSYTLLQEAEELGRLYITVEMKNESGAFLPRGFNERMLEINAADMDDRWRVFEAKKQPGRKYDYVARISIRDIQVSPERSQERQYIDEKEITDGEEYVLDGNGNVSKDSLGNDIKQPKIVIIRADVFEVLQTKSAVVSGSFELYDLRQQRVVDQNQLTAEVLFDNYASTFQGDRRALSSASRRNIGNQPVNFPSNEQLILDAADVLKPILQEQLASSYRLL